MGAIGNLKFVGMGNPNLTIMYFLGSGGLCSGNGSFALGLWDAHWLNFWCVLVEGDLVSPGFRFVQRSLGSCICGGSKDKNSSCGGLSG